MHVDELIIGSGLAGLGVLLGLAQRKCSVGILMENGSVIQFYPETQTPAQHLGHGGLGKYWHGVIPLGIRYRPPFFKEAAWEELLELFYPGAALASEKGLFVPKHPIRAHAEIDRILAQTSAISVAGRAIRIEPKSSCVNVTLDDNRAIQTGRCWLAAGTLGTTNLLADSGLIAQRVRSVSDHMIGYAGQVERSEETDAYFEDFCRTSNGVIMPSRFDANGDYLYTLRPARFDFSKRDAGITKRAVFGQPTNRAVAGVMRSVSLGLVSEALFNKFGLFRTAKRYSVYFQSHVANALTLGLDSQLARPPDFNVTKKVERGIMQSPFRNLDATKETGLAIPGIHLHGTIGSEEEKQFGTGSEHASIELVDAATFREMGPEHHSFTMMARAYAMAKGTL
jgi:hypothetical protein